MFVADLARFAVPLTTPIIQLIDRKPVTVEIDQRVSDAWRILMSGRIHHLPVVRGRKLVGLLRTSDMLELGAASLVSGDAASLELLDRIHKLDDLMSKQIIRVSDRATVAEAARQLSAGGFHSLPVVDRGDELVGIVTTTDLINHMLDATPKLDLDSPTAGHLRALEQVYKAAQAYLHSGMAAQEHARLEAALDAVRRPEVSI